MEKINKRDLLYKKITTSPIDVIGVLDDNFDANPLIVTHKIVAKYIEKISEGSINKRIVDGFYTLLCYEYNYTAGSPEPEQNFDKTLFNIIVKYIYQNYDQQTDQQFIDNLYEIIVLYLKLYFKIPEIIEIFKNFVTDAKNYNNDSNNIYYKIIDCFLDAFCLKCSPSYQEITEAGTLILDEMISCYKDIKTKDWDVFVTIIIKMIRTFERRLVLDYFWVMILNYSTTEWEKSLQLLNRVIDDVLILSSKEQISVNYNCCHSEMLWQLIIQGLMSSIEQNHKSGLKSMKKIFHFLQQFPIPSNKTSTIIPFIYCPNYTRDLAVKHAENYFFLLMESFEKGQEPLVCQTILQFDNVLVRFQKTHCLYCSDCLNFIWLKCIYKRALEHRVPEVVKTGIMSLIKLNPRYFYYPDLLPLLTVNLNTVIIFDSESFYIEPQITKELAQLFVKSEYVAISLIKKFIFHASEVTWSPIPLFYVVYCLSKAGYMVNYPLYHNIFQEKELKCLQVIVEKYLTKQIFVSKDTFCQNIINIINLYVSVSNQSEVNSLAKIYSALEASSSCRDSIINSLRLKVTSNQASQYIVNQCRHFSKLLTEENREEIVGLENFAKMTVYLFNATLIFRDSNAPELRALCNILNTIVVDRNKVQNIDTKVMELLDYFIKELNKNCTTDQLNFCINSFMGIFESVLISVVNIFRLPISYSYEELEIYTKTFNTVSELLILKEEDYRQYFTEVQIETERVIETLNTNQNKSIQYIFALKLLFSCIKYLRVCNQLTLDKLLNTIKNAQPIKIVCSGDKGDEKLTDESYKLIANLIVELIKQIPKNTVFTKALDCFQMIEQLLTPRNHQVLIPAADLMIQSLDLKTALSHSEVIRPFYMRVWNNLLAMKEDKTFLKCFEMCADFAFKFVELAKVEHYRELGRNYVIELFEKAKNISRLRRILIKKLVSADRNSFVILKTIALKIFIHVDEQQNLAVQRLESQIQYFGYSISDPDKKALAAIDMINRAKLILMLSTTAKEIKGFASHIRTEVLTHELEIRLLDHDINSDRVKCRVMQVLLVLQPYFDPDRALKVIKVISEYIVGGRSSFIVRTLQEWLLMKIFLMYINLVKELWVLFERVKFNPEGIKSVALIIKHVGANALPEAQALLFVRYAVRKLEIFVNIKDFHGYYCQLVLVKMIKLLPLHYQIKYENLKKTAEINLSSSKFLTQLNNEFFLHKFHPQKNYSIKTIFCALPKVMNSLKCEWILPSMLDTKSFNKITDSSAIKINTLKNIATTQSKSQPSGERNINSIDNDIEMVEVE